MSISSALVVGLALCLIDLSEIAADPAFTSEITSPEQLGEYLGTVENGQSFGALAGHRGVGTFGGRSEERRVGKESRSRWGPVQQKQEDVERERWQEREERGGECCAEGGGEH